MANHLDSAEIELPCGNCGRKTKKSIGWVKSNRSFNCSCGSRVEFDPNQFRQQIAKIENALRGLGGR